MLVAIMAAVIFTVVSIMGFIEGGTFGMACGVLFGVCSTALIVTLIKMGEKNDTTECIKIAKEKEKMDD